MVETLDGGAVRADSLGHIDGFDGMAEAAKGVETSAGGQVRGQMASEQDPERFHERDLLPGEHRAMRGAAA